MNIELFLIRCLENLHVGEGTESTDFVDKKVQKEGVQPVIHSSSLKGALREYFENKWKDKVNEKKENVIEIIFGTNPKSDTSKPGKFRFFSAFNLALPVRSNVRPYYLALSIEYWNEFAKKTQLYCPDLKARIEDLNKEFDKVTKSITKPTAFTNQTNSSILLEDILADKKTDDIAKLKTLLFDNELAIYPHAEFKKQFEHLPIQARNHLENGVSQNLWYEEYVPRESVFYTYIDFGNVDKDLKNDFINELENTFIQIGANATIGYGIVKFKRGLYETKPKS